jgi:hypothetical protein
MGGNRYWAVGRVTVRRCFRRGGDEERVAEWVGGRGRRVTVALIGRRREAEVVLFGARERRRSAVVEEAGPESVDVDKGDSSGARKAEDVIL